jgi:hypothetical protein
MKTERGFCLRLLGYDAFCWCFDGLKTGFGVLFIWQFLELDFQNDTRMTRMTLSRSKLQKELTLPFEFIPTSNPKILQTTKLSNYSNSSPSHPKNSRQSHKKTFPKNTQNHRKRHDPIKLSNNELLLMFQFQ